ncbi:MAG: hypothetical protein ACKPJJ_29290, partial [Planctomycetaceae bacterium]
MSVRARVLVPFTSGSQVQSAERSEVGVERPEPYAVAEQAGGGGPRHGDATERGPGLVCRVAKLLFSSFGDGCCGLLFPVVAGGII